MSSSGRDQPCPCGSGRRFSECCGLSALAPVGEATRDSALTKLLAFAFHPAFDSDHSIAEVLFWGKVIREGPGPELRWLLESEDATIKYNSWFLFDWEVDSSGTIAELFLQEEEARLSHAERQFVRRLAAAHLRLYEVEAIEPGVGVHLLDLWTGERRFVIERAATRQMATWDVLGARVAPDGIGGSVFEGGLYIYPAELKDAIVRHFRGLHRRHHRKSPFDTLDVFFRKHGAVFHHLWLNLVAFPDPPQLLTTDGDPLVFARSIFETDEPDAVRAALADRPEIHEARDGSLSWRETVEGHEHEVGSWLLEGNRLVLETTSQERAQRGRAWLESLCGPRVRYRATSLESLEQTMNDLRSQSPQPRDRPVELEATEDSGAVREMFDHHYRIWLDRPAPELGNRTPRLAAANRTWRPKVEKLLKQLENSAARTSIDRRPAYDFGWIWDELGLSRPGPPRAIS